MVEATARVIESEAPVGPAALRARKATCDDVLSGCDVSGRVVLVTGASSGLGFETARSLAAAGAVVIVGARTAEKAEQACAAIRLEHPSARLVPWRLELSAFAEIRRAVTRLPSGGIDVIVCNAGLFRGGYTETADGIEESVGVCHFGHFLLVNLLLDRLRFDRGARVVMVSSDAHRFPRKLCLEGFTKTKAAFAAYGQAKLCNILFAAELARRYGERGLVSVSVHPGALLSTNIARHSKSSQIVTLCARPFTKSVAQGAAMSVYAAAAPGVQSGKYYADFAEVEPSDDARDPDVASRLWSVSAERVGL